MKSCDQAGTIHPMPPASVRQEAPPERDFKGAPDRDLVEAIRRRSEPALIEFFRRFRPLLLREARGLVVQPALRAELVDDCLADVALRLLRHTMATPRVIAPYLIRALRLQRLKHHRAELRRRQVEGAGDAGGARGPADPTTRRSVPGAPNESRIGEATFSEATRRASEGPEWTPHALSPVLERLARMLDDGLTEDERLLLVWVGNWVPQSEIAAWLGITHGAARNRIMRLREHLKQSVVRAALNFTEAERAELQSFFRRASRISRRTPGAPAGGPATAPRPPDEPDEAGRGITVARLSFLL